MRLEAIASRIVFVIDWNRARKRLQQFVGKSAAAELLWCAAREDWGHMAWLQAGAEKLVFDAMQAVDSEAFRVGDRLDEVLGDGPAFEFMLELMRAASVMLREQQPASLLADEARMLLGRMLRQRTFEFDLIAEHAAYCHALAEGLCDALESVGAPGSAGHGLRCKEWERQADHQLMLARQRAERQGRWLPVVDLLNKADDVADALEEASFIHTLTQVEPLSGIPAPVNDVLCRLAGATLAAIQDQVRAIEIARHLNREGDAADGELFLQALWRMLRAERICDELSREGRRVVVRTLHAQPAAMLLANELVATIEKATDSLLAAGYALRQMVFRKTGLAS